MAKKVLLSTLLTTIIINAFTPLGYINSIREKSGAKKLTYDATLAKAAKKHATYVYKNSEYSHYENSSSLAYFAPTPWSRIVKAGFKTKVVVENISFFNSSYKASIEQLMATVYHRLAFLYLKIDSIGYANVAKMYVYDMSNSKIARICSKHYKNAPMIIDNICPNESDIVPQRKFNIAMNSLLIGAKKIIIYPYSNQNNVPTKGVEEVPKFLYQNFGYPITATFNSYYYRKVRLISFKLFKDGKEVPTKVVSNTNDINNKIRKGTYVLVPLNYLKHNSKYSVVLKADANGKKVVKKWSFTTK